MLLAVLKAMGQNAHLWKTWQCRSWMWLFSKAKVRWTTPQCTHLDDRGGGGVAGASDPEVALGEEDGAQGQSLLGALSPPPPSTRAPREPVC